MPSSKICLQKSPHFEKKSSKNPPSYGLSPVTHGIFHGSTRVNEGVTQGEEHEEFFIWVWLKVVKVSPSGWKLGRLATTKRAGTRWTRTTRTPTSCGALCVSLIVRGHYLKNSYLEGYLQRLIWVFRHVFQGHLAQDSFSEKISNIDTFDEIFSNEVMIDQFKLFNSRSEKSSKASFKTCLNWPFVTLFSGG